MTTLFDEIESIALARQDPPADQVPSGVPEDELGRIQKWRASNKAAFAATAKDDEVELSIIGIIGGGWLGDGISARSVKRFLDDNKEAKSIRALVDSPGGDYFDGVAIMNLFKRHPAKVTVEVIGEASSAGSVLAMGADDVEMHTGTVMMVHRAWTVASGNGDEMRTAGSQLDRIDDQLGAVYATRTGKPRAEIDKLVAATTHMTAKEAVEKGFADRELPARTKPKPAAAGGVPRAQASDPNEPPPAPLPAPAIDPPTPPVPETRKPAPANLGEEHNTMALPKIIITALSLPEDADEGAAAAAVTRLKNSAKLGADVEQLLGVTGQAALGAVRALKEGNEANAELGTEVAKLKIVNVRRDFDALIVQGTDAKNKKLSPAVVKLYNERFENALKIAQGEDGDADAAAEKAGEICADLKGFIAVASRITSSNISPPGGGSGGGSGSSEGGAGGAMLHNSKSFEAMAPRERKALKDENPDLYNAMRDDATERGAI